MVGCQLASSCFNLRHTEQIDDVTQNGHDDVTWNGPGEITREFPKFAAITVHPIMHGGRMEACATHPIMYGGWLRRVPTIRSCMEACANHPIMHGGWLEACATHPPNHAWRLVEACANHPIMQGGWVEACATHPPDHAWQLDGGHPPDLAQEPQVVSCCDVNLWVHDVTV
jgi:hypothetical protein